MKEVLFVIGVAGPECCFEISVRPQVADSKVEHVVLRDRGKFEDVRVLVDLVLMTPVRLSGQHAAVGKIHSVAGQDIVGFVRGVP